MTFFGFFFLFPVSNPFRLFSYRAMGMNVIAAKPIRIR